jgi:hypothetical protein
MDQRPRKTKWQEATPAQLLTAAKLMKAHSPRIFSQHIAGAFLVGTPKERGDVLNVFGELFEPFLAEKKVGA